MKDTFTFTIDDLEIEGTPGQTIMEAADAAGVYIPRLCFMEGLVPHGSCRVCTVMIDGRPDAACTRPATAGIHVENDTPKIQEMRRRIVEMLFVEGNHYCMFCEKSGNCELQGVAYRLGITAPRYPLMFPDREVDMSHPDLFIDRQRCILCGRCVAASRDLDGKHAFDFRGRSIEKVLAVNAEDGLATTDAARVDKAAEACPVGALMKKRVGFAVPIGERLYDTTPIGSDIEAKRPANATR